MNSNEKKLSIFILLLSLSSCIGQTESRDVSLFVDAATYESAFVDYYVNNYKTSDSDDKSTTEYLFGFKESKVDERSLNEWRKRDRIEGSEGSLPIFCLTLLRTSSIFSKIPSRCRLRK